MAFSQAEAKAQYEMAQKIAAEQVLRAAKAAESKLDQHIERLENMTDEDMARLRAKRIEVRHHAAGLV